MDESEPKRRRIGWRAWLAIALLLPVMYVVSFGPACWFSARRDQFVPFVYAPLGEIINLSIDWGPDAEIHPHPVVVGIGELLQWWGSLGTGGCHIKMKGWSFSFLGFGN